MNIDNADETYVERVQRAMDAMHCPACGGKAQAMSIGWDRDLGVMVVAPVFSCGTPGCQFNVEGPNAWIPASTA